jgi:hypothetical protein
VGNGDGVAILCFQALSGEQTERGDRNRGGKAQVAWTPHFQQEGDAVRDCFDIAGFGRGWFFRFWMRGEGGVGGGDGDNFRCVGDEICREGLGCPGDTVRPWVVAFAI